MPGWMTNKLESRLPGEISTTSDMQVIPLVMAENEEELKSLLMKEKEKSEKACLKLSVQKTKIMASGPITSWQIDGGKMETVKDFLFLDSKITTDSDCSHGSKRCLLLGRKAVTNRSRFKKQKHPFADKGHLVKALVFPVVMYGCESWNIKLNAEELMLLNCRVGEDS